MLMQTPYEPVSLSTICVDLHQWETHPNIHLKKSTK